MNTENKETWSCVECVIKKNNNSAEVISDTISYLLEDIASGGGSETFDLISQVNKFGGNEEEDYYVNFLGKTGNYKKLKEGVIEFLNELKEEFKELSDEDSKIKPILEYKIIVARHYID